MRFRAVAALLAGITLAVSSARAGVSYSYQTDSLTYSGAVGSTVTVNIYLVETLTNGSSSIITQKGGIFSAGAGVNQVNTTTATGDATIGSNAFTFATAFSGPQAAYYNQGNNQNVEFIENRPTGSTSGPTPDSSGKVLLGSLAITVGSNATQYILTSLYNDTINGSNSQLGQTDGNTFTVPGSDGGYDLDSTSNSSLYTGADAAPGFVFTISPAAVPEPSSMLLCGLAAAGMGYFGYRRRNKVQAEVTEAVA